MDPNNPREAWKKFQNALNQAQKSGGPRGGMPGGAPKGIIGGGVGLLLLGGAFVLANNALFNGSTILYKLSLQQALKLTEYQ